MWRESPRLAALDLQAPRRAYARTPVSRMGFLPDLEPLLHAGEWGLASPFLRRTCSSPSCSPQSSFRHHGVGAGPVTSVLFPLPEKGVFQLDGEEEASPERKASGPAEEGGSGGKAGVWGTVFNLCSATLGAGALSLPYAFEQVGIIGGVGCVVATALTAHYSITLLVSALIRSGARSYEELTVKIFGKRMGLLVELNIVLFCFGSAIAYTVAVGDVLEPMLALPAVRRDRGPREPTCTEIISPRCAARESPPAASGARTHRTPAARASHLGLAPPSEQVHAAVPWLGRGGVMSFFWLVLMLPLSLVESMSELQCASLFGVASLFYLVLTVVAHAVLSAYDIGGLPVHDGRVWIGAHKPLAATPAQLASPPSWRLLTFSAQSLSAIAVVMFAFTNQVNVPFPVPSLYLPCTFPVPSPTRSTCPSLYLPCTFPVPSLYLPCTFSQVRRGSCLQPRIGG